MNDRISELARHAGIYIVPKPFDVASQSWNDTMEKFVELIVEEHINLLKQEWYSLNNLPNVENEGPREIGMRVGRKGQIISLIGKIKKHFGVE